MESLNKTLLKDIYIKDIRVIPHFMTIFVTYISRLPRNAFDYLSVLTSNWGSTIFLHFTGGHTTNLRKVWGMVT